MALHEAAELLGCTVPELQRRVSYRELSDWLLYLDGKQRKREKIEYYFAELIVMLGAFHGADIWTGKPRRIRRRPRRIRWNWGMRWRAPSGR